MRHSTYLPGAAALGLTALLLAGCATQPAATSSEAPAEASASTPTPRLAVTYDGGIAVLDAETLEQVGDLPIDGFTRVNPAGDGRHVFVTVPEGFRLLDTGAWTTGGESFAEEPELTDEVVGAEAAGHVVVHADRTVLFADGTGDFTTFATADLLKGEGIPESRTLKSEAAHHGVAIELADGSFISTLGDADGRTGARVLDADGTETARFEECPGIHGEATAKDEVVVFGCENGAIVWDGEGFAKLTSPDAYGRIGNMFTTEDSVVALGDYKNDPDLEGYVLSAFSIIDTEEKTLEVVDLPDGVGYTFRDLARGADNELVILATDGSLHVFDESGAQTAAYPVIDAWEGPAEWQDPHPALKVQDGVAYVTEPATNRLLAVDLATGKTLAEATLPGAPNELAVVTG